MELTLELSCSNSNIVFLSTHEVVAHYYTEAAKHLGFEEVICSPISCLGSLANMKYHKKPKMRHTPPPLSCAITSLLDSKCLSQR